MHHGSIRQTDDLDVCPRWSRENLDRLGTALSELRAELAIAPGETVPVPVIDGVLLGRMEIGTWQTQASRFDVLRGIPKTATTRAEFEELSARAITSEISGRAVRVADLEDVARSKRIAGRPRTTKPCPNSTISEPPPLAALRKTRTYRRHRGMSPRSRRLPPSAPTGLHPLSNAREARTSAAEAPAGAGRYP
jgi:hypothetical protein